MKAILVIDMPKSCAECTLRTSLESNYLYCIATLPRLKIDPMTAHHIKEHKCPLKPMPDCPEVPDTISNDVAYIIGWNDCIVEISKERKEAKTLIRNEEESVSNRGER